MRISDWSSDVCSSDLSSLAAREPALYNYGWSKERAEAIVQGSGLDWTIVRPPAVFGPGDTEMLDMFRMARRGIALVPSGRMSAIYVDELARLLVTLAADRTASIGQIYDDRKSVVWGKSVSVRVDLGGGRISQKKKK